MLLAEALAFFVLIMLCFARETVIGRWLHIRLVERPARRLGAIKRTVWVFGTLVFVAVVVLVWVARGDGVMVASFSLPDLAVWFTTFEVSTWADAVAAVALAASLARLRTVAPWLRGSIQRCWRRLRPARGEGGERRQEPLS